MTSEDHDQNDSRPQRVLDGAKRRRVKIAMVVAFALVVIAWAIIASLHRRVIEIT